MSAMIPRFPAPLVDGAADASRRRILGALAAAAAARLAPAFGQPLDFWSLPRELWLYRPSSNESVRAVYWADGQLVPDGYNRICQLLRDVQRNEVVQFDFVTLDIARGIYGWLRANGVDRPLIINSGYRHPSTNASEGGVRNSLHTMARAIDLRIEGVGSEKVGAFAQYLAGGGVGFYPGRNFTHIDRGNVKSWVGK
jgi:uncharacterized protein YcbK (DUF882 family)